MGSDKHPESFKHHNINGEDSNSTMIDPEPNVMDSSIHINTNNAGSHYEKNFDNNDDFFEGLDDFFDKSMAHSTIGTSVVQAYKPSAFIIESQSSNKFIENGSSIVTDKASEYNPIGYENDEFYKNVEPLSIFVKIAWREIKENNFEYPHYLTNETRERFNLKLTNTLEGGQQFFGKTDGYDNFHFTQHDIIEEKLGNTYNLMISINEHNVRLYFLRI
uniref:Galectin n=1 Tax=Meloidogyne floridensis TaxID=298350 RepID=A0A915NF10_9BILA